jgi:hypothetical protein
MSAPLITQEQIVEALKASMVTSWNMPVYGEFPSDPTAVRFGLYAGEVVTTDRNPNGTVGLGVTLGSNVYNAKDQFDIVYISFQDDSNAYAVGGAISQLVTYTAAGATAPLFNGYHERDFTQTLEYGPNRVKYTWTFNLVRLEFQ